MAKVALPLAALVAAMMIVILNRDTGGGMLDDISLETGGWSLDQESETRRRWTNDAGDIMRLELFNLPPDLPSPLSDLGPTRSKYRESLADVSGGLVEVERTRVSDADALRTIFKIPQESSGMSYIGAFTLPFQDLSVVLKFQCVEQGITGMRDAAVFAKHGEVDKQGNAIGWAEDPYDSSYTRPVLRNRADDPEWDEHFPQHPLSRLRRYLAAAQGATTFGPAFSGLPPFRPQVGVVFALSDAPGATCSLCGKSEPDVFGVATVEKSQHTVCDECLRLVLDVIVEESTGKRVDRIPPIPAGHSAIQELASRHGATSRASFAAFLEPVLRQSEGCQPAHLADHHCGFCGVSGMEAGQLLAGGPPGAKLVVFICGKCAAAAAEVFLP